MKNIILIILIFCGLEAQSQDSLTVETLKKISYSFTIDEGKMTGDGADFLAKNIGMSQYTMMGEYHGSYQISLLTEALIPQLKKAGYETFIAEIGTYSTKVLSEISKDPLTTKKNLRQLNAKYNYDEGDYSSIPFFLSEEDASFLQEISKANMTIMGIDQEFIYGFPMLIDEMFNQIPSEFQEQHKSMYMRARDTINRFVDLEEKGEADLQILMRDSDFIQTYITSIQSYGDNEEIAIALRKSIEIYALNNARKWYLNNKTRVQYMKDNLRKGFKKNYFDLYRDKAFAKMGAYHLHRGYNPMGLYDVGNTLNELAAFHGNETFSFTFLNRYFTEEGTTMDMMEEEKLPALANFIRMGKKDSWTVIDLRPLIEGTEFHPVKYKLTAAEEEYIKHYDVVLIPPVDRYVTLLK